MWTKSRAGIFLLGSLFGGSSSYLLLKRGSQITKWGLHHEETSVDPNDEVPSRSPPEDTSGKGSPETHTDLTDDTLFKYGVPQIPISFYSYKSHSLAHDSSRKVPLWVAETITNERVHSKVASRKKSRFRPDPSIPPCYSSANEDYRHSNWSRGHMAPAGDCKHSQEAMDDTFYLTNIVPQDLANNNGYWNRLEMYCRDLTKKFDHVHVITGPLFLPELDQESENTYVKYQVLGQNRVAVPTHLFKVVLAEGGEKQALGVFIIPNKPVENNVDLARFQVQDLCSVDGCKLKSLERMALAAFTRKLSSAGSLEELDRVWKELNQSTVKPDSKAEEVFVKRKTELRKLRQPDS